MINRLQQNPLLVLYSSRRLQVTALICLLAISTVLFGPLVKYPTYQITLNTSRLGSIFYTMPTLPVEIGAGTKIFLSLPEISDMGPKPIRTISRPLFSVKGTIITLQYDNLEAFEYPNSQMAAKDMSVLSANTSLPTSVFGKT